MHVFKATKTASDRFPFEIARIDSDNGSEFINAIMLKYCIDNKITFTRSRAYKKNDTAEELDILNELYIYLDYYTNYFQPVVKLQSKTRTGSKTVKKYDEAKTPFRRVLESKYIDDKIKAGLRKQYNSLNPAELKRKITKLQDKLIKLNSLKKTLERNSIVDENPYEYIYK